MTSPRNSSGLPITPDSATAGCVRKAVSTLVRQNVLIKENRQYSISKDWILKLKSFFDNLLVRYAKGKKVHTFDTRLAKEDYAVYTFSSLLDLDNFWTDILEYLAEHEEKNHFFFGAFHYPFWFLINLGSETRLFKLVKKLNFDIYMVFMSDVPLNKWGAKVYNDMEVNTHVMNDRKTSDTIAFNVMGDTVIQVYYSKVIRNKLKSIYSKYKSVQEISIQEITKLANEPCEINLVMLRNPAFAQNIKDTYLKLFK